MGQLKLLIQIASASGPVERLCHSYHSAGNEPVNRSVEGFNPIERPIEKKPRKSDNFSQVSNYDMI